MRLSTLLSVLAACAALALLASPGASAADPLLAPVDACPDPALAAPAATQIKAMLCYHAYARRRLGRSPLHRSIALYHSAGLKSRWIVGCDAFTHTPCGHSFPSVFQAVRYIKRTWVVGENLAWGSGPVGRVREMFDRWLHSRGHRENILRPEWHDVGVSVFRMPRLFGYPHVTVWVVHFGRH